ncbi:MAG: TlpA disulfide reductase family protein [Ginsengibacter sp.]
MKTFLLFLFLLPVFAFTQSVNNIKPTAVKGFMINGDVTGFPDGTTVSFLNEQTGQPEEQATIEKGKFVIKGELPQPGFKGIIFGDQPPLVPVFLDNSAIKITGDKNSIELLKIKGSPSHDLYVSFNNQMKTYDSVVAGGGVLDEKAMAEVANISDKFVKKNVVSFVAPLAIIRMYQMTQDGKKAEELYRMLPAPVQSGNLGQFVNQQIQESKINPIGSVVKDFSQSDTVGNPLNISSFRGKYVLIDFWASWCRPCRMENPNVVAAFNKYRDKNFTILSVSLDQAKPAWVSAIQMDGLNWSHVSDLKGWNNEVAALFQVKSIPQNLLIDPDGKIVAKNLRGSVLDDKLNTLLR